MKNLGESKASSLIITITILILASNCLAEEGKPYLEKGIKSYKDADFDKSISEIQKAIEIGLKEQTDLIQAHLYLGFAYIAKNKRIDAVVEFAKVIHLDPELILDPKIYSSKIISAFNETKASLTDSLTVISIPGGADVFLDGKKVGATPLKLDNVITGDHNITISKNFFISQTINISVLKGEDNRVQIQLEKKEIEIKIISNPPEAIVYVSGNPIGKTPISFKLSPDEDLSIKLAKEEYTDKELNIRLTSEGVRILGTDQIIPVVDSVADIQIEMLSTPNPGSLTIQSKPNNALVYLDRIEKGRTPLTIPKVTPGNREITVTIKEFDTITKKVEVKSNSNTEIEFILGGSAMISSVPSNANVFIDGKQIGITPLKTDLLSIGSHQVRLSKDKYADKTMTILIERGKEKVLSARLSEQKGSLAISSDPEGSAVYINNELKGNTPIFLYGLAIGEYTIKMAKSGFDDWIGKVVIKENEVSWLFGKLKIK